jgi:hypothetical protein
MAAIMAATIAMTITTIITMVIKILILLLTPTLQALPIQVLTINLTLVLSRTLRGES